MSGVDGNADQVRAVAEQLFAVWEKRQRNKGLLHGSLPAWAAFALSIGVAIYNGGVLAQTLSDAVRRIQQLEADAREDDRAQIATVQQLARIEAKVDLAISERGR